MLFMLSVLTVDDTQIITTITTTKLTRGLVQKRYSIKNNGPQHNSTTKIYIKINKL